MTREKSKRVIGIIKNALRILCVVIFVRHILPFGSYASSINYHEAIEDKEIKDHQDKTENYTKNKDQPKSISEIEDDILSQIEEKKKLGNKKLPQKLKKEQEELKKKDNPSPAEKEALEEKEKVYQTKLKNAKANTIKNIQEQLKNNQLDATELDNRK
ncbi:23657_t:CDS:2 [Entrophospora sp. SA101]|nr:15092_t:CDS:2 [Entrophospora sp. SA101]CAJ0749007.1 23657_t:CDS:2 [Entrophospora sp. SA101]CAJ0845125.1 8019_t:CDS:2 [Entrophospora sp. SA101]